MYRKLALCLCVVLFSAVTAAAQNVNDVKKDAQSKTDGESKVDKTSKTANPSEAKELSGMSIVGNDEAPKSLYIVPWKGSEIGAETGLNMKLNEDDVPVDRDVFKRKLEFYQVSTEK